VLKIAKGACRDVTVSDTVEIALIGVAGAAVGGLITALIQPLWANFVSKQSRLFVEVRHFPFLIPHFLSDQIDGYVYNYQLNFKPSQQTKDRLRQIKRAEGLSQINIRNQSKRSIDELVVHMSNNQDLVGDIVMDGNKKESIFGTVCEIGTLRAGATCQIALWTPIDSTSRWSNAREKIVISAKEYDRISLKFPAPGYISENSILVSRKVFWRTFWTILILFNIWTWINLYIHLNSKGG
jgi:hypothetical protein